MSFLAPLYLLGGLALSLPVLLHLIRRTPSGRQPFSSLMFLAPSPPRITRRSRIEHWLLLALRAAALALIALAFARPFLRETSNLMLDRGRGQRIAIVLDASASMQRVELWTQAKQRAERILAALSSDDEIGLFVFDDAPRTVVDFANRSTDRTTHRTLVQQELKKLAPTWRATNLGRALSSVADSLASLRRADGGDRSSQIVLISDLQHGAELAALQAYDWPRDVFVTLESVRAGSPDNAAVRLLTDDEHGVPRARIENVADATTDQFTIGWAAAAGELQSPATVYVPAGQTRVVKLPEPPPGVDRVRITGDGHDFDNDFFVGPVTRQEWSVAYLGNDLADDATGLRYFLERVWPETPRRRVTITGVPTTGNLDRLAIERPQLLVIGVTMNENQSTAVVRFVEAGGTALVVAAAQTQPNPDATSNARKVFALLTDLDVTHPILEPFANPRYGDFSKVHIWKWQPASLVPADARILARFDGGDPALWDRPLGKGHIVELATSWRPTESQLALSSKFVPLLASLLNWAAGASALASPSVVVGEPPPMPRDAIGTSPIVADTERPGVFHWQTGDKQATFAVNLAASESDTTPREPSQLEQLGVRIGKLPNPIEEIERERQLRDVELESRQKLWQWMLFVAIGLLGAESMLAGWTNKQQNLRDDKSP